MSFKKDSVFEYSPKEEQLNVVTHILGIILSIYITISLFQKVMEQPESEFYTVRMTGIMVYGISLIILFFASTIYHHPTNRIWKKKLKTFDHICVYFLIAGTYTPFILLKYSGDKTFFLSVTWIMALLGMTLKLTTEKRTGFLSLASYFSMALLGAFAKESLINNLSTASFNNLIFGGVALTIGVGFFCYEKLYHHHGILHIFVLIGIFLHYRAVYLIL